MTNNNDAAALQAPAGGKLDAALAWAARGIRVFPLRAGSKLPAMDGWTISATTDPIIIREMWTRTDPVIGTQVELDYNVGVLTSDIIVFDLDTKDGKRGLETFLRLGLEFDTLVVRTPSGGFHAYYRGIGREVGSSHLVSPTDGMDVKSHNGYVAAPGSTIDGVPYTVEIDEPVADFPVELRPLLKAPRLRRDASGVSVELDLPEALELAAHWLRREAPIAVQGENGDDATYRVACRVRDFGVSEEVALDLMLDHWNDRCEPPWSVHEVRLKVENAYRYATGEAGSASPAALFDCVVHVPPWGTGGPPEHEEHQTLKVKKRGCFEPIPFNDITYSNGNRWLVKGLLASSGLATIFGRQKEYKSFIALDLALAVARGVPWAGRRVKQGAVIYIAAEGANGFADRVAGNRQKFDLPGDLPFFLIKGKPNLGVVTGDRGALIAAIEPTMRGVGIPLAAIFIDTLVRTLAGSSENDEGMRNFTDNAEAVAEHFDCLAVAVHHLGKDATRGMRGSSALAGAVVTSWRVEKTRSMQARVTLDDAKDGESGLEWLVELERYVFGQDEDGDEESVLLVREISDPVPAEVTPSAPAAAAAEAKAELVFLALLKRFAHCGRDVSPNHSQAFAPTVFAKQQDAEGCSKRELGGAMDRLMAVGKIMVELRGSPSRRRSVLVAADV